MMTKLNFDLKEVIGVLTPDEILNTLREHKNWGGLYYSGYKYVTLEFPLRNGFVFSACLMIRLGELEHATYRVHLDSIGDVGDIVSQFYDEPPEHNVIRVYPKEELYFTAREPDEIGTTLINGYVVWDKDNVEPSLDKLADEVHRQFLKLFTKLEQTGDLIESMYRMAVEGIEQNRQYIEKATQDIDRLTAECTAFENLISLLTKE